MRKLVIACCLVLCGVALLAIKSQIQYEWGTEFSPDVFQHRMYHCYLLMGTRITRKVYESKKWALDEYLHKKGFNPPSDRSEPRWWCVQSFRSPTRDRGATGDAYFVCISLGTYPSERDHWIPWSEKHPDIAQVLWPQVVALLRQDQLEKAQRFLAAADGCETMKEFSEELAERDR
jgi:hypothetical protein